MKGGAGPGGQGGCIEVIVKFEEKSREEVRSGSGWGVRSGGGMGGCEQRIEVIVCENAKKVRMVHYVNDSVLIKFSQKTNVFTLIIINSP